MKIMVFKTNSQSRNPLNMTSEDHTQQSSVSLIDQNNTLNSTTNLLEEDLRKYDNTFEMASERLASSSSPRKQLNWT